MVFEKVCQEIPTSNVAPGIGHFVAFPREKVGLSPASNKIHHTSVEIGSCLTWICLTTQGNPRQNIQTLHLKVFRKCDNLKMMMIPIPIFSPRRNSSECLAVSVWAALLKVAICIIEDSFKLAKTLISLITYRLKTSVSRLYLDSSQSTFHWWYQWHTTSVSNNLR